MTAPQPESERDLILALFKRIGQQAELKEEWDKLPNAERNAMAGDFYNILHGSTTSAEQVLEELPKLSSTELLLIAHDEWKNRMERKHLFEEDPWVSGWINGFMTSRKWVNEQAQKLRQRGREQG